MTASFRCSVFLVFVVLLLLNCS